MAVVCTDPHTYCRALTCFYYVHCALEQAVRTLADLPEVRPVAQLLPRVTRRARFEEDLKFWLGCAAASTLRQRMRAAAAA